MAESLYTNETPASQTPETPTPSVGTVIVVAVAGQVTHLKWFCPSTPPSNAATVPFVLYNDATQAQLARVVPGSLVAGAWNTAALSSPVNVTAGQRLVVAVYADRYTFTSGYFSSSGRTVGNLTAPATESDPGGIGNGRFRSGADGWPNATFGGNNYWTDLVFEPGNTTTSVSSTLTGKWRIYGKVSTSLTSKWAIQAAPAPVPVTSSGYLAAQRAATAAFIADDPTSVILVPHGRVKTASGGFSVQAGSPRTAQVIKMVLLNADQRPVVTVAGVERVADYHLIGPWDMSIAVGDVWEASDGTRWEVLAFSEGWEYMTKAIVGRHIPREGRA